MANKKKRGRPRKIEMVDPLASNGKTKRKYTRRSSSMKKMKNGNGSIARATFSVIEALEPIPAAQQQRVLAAVQSLFSEE